MEKRNFKGLKKYEPLLQTICRTDDYYKLPENEWEGCLGVACVISAIEGVVPNMFSLSKHLDVPHYNKNLQKAFERLRINGIFSDKYDVKNDKKLNGQAEDAKMASASELERNAWCTIAGIAGGLVGVKDN
jgi:hypothetical protein